MHEELANLPVTFALFQYHHCVQGYVIQKIRRRQRAVRVLFDQVKVSQKNGAKLRLCASYNAQMLICKLFLFQLN